MNKEVSIPYFIEGRRLFLRPLLENDFNQKYLKWLNDPEINACSQRRPFPQTWQQMLSYPNYYEQNPAKGFVLAVVDKASEEHIGNLSMIDLSPVNRCANISILIGRTDYWGQGYGRESIYLLSKHGFREMNLHKLVAGTFNPAFVKCVEKIGWKIEGVFREKIWSDGRYHDQVWLSQLSSEFRVIEEFE